MRDLGLQGEGKLTLLLEVVVSLEATAQTINGLASLPNPKSNGVYCSSQGPHLSSFSTLSIQDLLSLRDELNFLGVLSFNLNAKKREVGWRNKSF